MDELKILALEARNHLYAIFKDSEVWQEALQSMWHTTLLILLRHVLICQAGRVLDLQNSQEGSARITKTPINMASILTKYLLCLTLTVKR